MRLAAEAREAWRLDRLYPRLTREERTAVARAEGRLGWVRSWPAVGAFLLWTFPPVLPLLAGTRSLWAAVAVASIVGVPAQLAAKDLRIHAFEALHAPSRRGLVVARWAKRLPWSLWVGACAAGYLWIKLTASPSCPTPWTSYLAIGLAPSLWALFKTSDAKQETPAMQRACETAYSAVRALTATTAAAFMGASVFGPQGASGGVTIGFGLVGIFALLFWWSMGAGLRDLRLLGLGSVAPVHFVCRVGSAVAATAWFLALIGLTGPTPEKAAQFFERYGDAFGAAGLAVTFGAGWFFVRERLRHAQTAENIAFAKMADASSGAGPARTSLPSRPGRARPGVGLWRAQWRLFGEKHPCRGLPLVGTSLRFVLYALPPALGASAIVASGYGLPWWFVVAAVLAAPALIAVGDAHAERLRLFGIDDRERALHDLRVTLIVAAAPTLVTAVVAGTIIGWTDAGVLVLCALAAGFICRAGGYGFGGDAPWRLTALAWMTVLGAPYLLSLYGEVSDPAAAWLIVVGLSALGLVGILRRIRSTETLA